MQNHVVKLVVNALTAASTKVAVPAIDYSIALQSVSDAAVAAEILKRGHV